MHTTLIVARLRTDETSQVAKIFEDFDRTEMPDLMGTRRRQLFHYRGLYFHLQDFTSDGGGHVIEQVRQHPLFVQVSEDLKPYIAAFDPATWRSPADAMATRFYEWTAA